MMWNHEEESLIDTHGVYDDGNVLSFVNSKLFLLVITYLYLTGVSRGGHGVYDDGMRLRTCRGCDNEGKNFLYIVKISRESILVCVNT